MSEPAVPELSDTLAADSRGRVPLLDPAQIVLRPIELSTEVVSTVEGLRALKPDYERLERVTTNTLPFSLHEWHLTWCEHLLDRQPQREQRLQLIVLRNRSGECVALVPLVLSHSRIGPLRVATLGFLGSGDGGVTEIRAALVEPGYERLSVRCVYDCMSGVPGWQWLHWRDANEALASALALELGPRWHEVRQACLLDLPASWQEFRTRLPRNIRESLRHGYNSLRRDGYTFDFVVARRPAEVLEALPRFLQLHALRANMGWGPRHRDYFASAQLRQFLHSVCAKLAARDAVRVFQLRVAGTVVASQVGFVVDHSLYMYYSGFDPAWARYGAMTTTLAEALRYAIAQGLRTVDLSPTPIRSKLRWRPRLQPLRSCVLHREAFASRLACRAYGMVASGHTLPMRVVRHWLRSQFGRD